MFEQGSAGITLCCEHFSVIQWVCCNGDTTATGSTHQVLNSPFLLHLPSLGRSPNDLAKLLILSSVWFMWLCIHIIAGSCFEGFWTIAACGSRRLLNMVPSIDVLPSSQQLEIMSQLPLPVCVIGNNSVTLWPCTLRPVEVWDRMLHCFLY